MPQALLITTFLELKSCLSVWMNFHILDLDDEELFLDASDTSPVRRSTSKETSPAAEDLTLSPTWRYKKKHFFILSDAGKPIYSRYGDEDQLASLMAVMQATVSFVQDMSDNIRAIKSNGTSIVFLNRKPLILVNIYFLHNKLHGS